MIETIFQGIFEGNTTETVAIGEFVACIAAALVIGLILTAAYCVRTRYTKSFVMTLALLPAAVCVVIMMVNGNVGAGVAVAGAFSLIRFRSVPGTAREIGSIFLAMGAGLMCGMGYLGYAVLFSVLMGAVMALYACLDFGTKKNTARYKLLRITIPEDLDYTDVFEDLLCDYTKEHELVGVKTTNMGSMFRLTYTVTMKDPRKEKEMIDQLRCRNGNLEIGISRQEIATYEL